MLQVERIDSLTRSLLDLSRWEAGEPTGIEQRVELSAMLQDLAEPYASRGEQAGLTFSLEVEGDPVWVQGSAAQLWTMLHNLLDNPIKFTPPGGQINVHLQGVDGDVRLSVSDTGISIPAEDLLRLFSRFHRGRNASAYPGSGLGLAIVRAIADRHGAEIQVKSKLGSTQVVVEFSSDRKFNLSGRQPPP